MVLFDRTIMEIKGKLSISIEEIDDLIVELCSVSFYFINCLYSKN